MPTLRIGSRGSKLALCQAEQVRQQLAAFGQGCEIVVIRTTGDEISTGRLSEVGGKGLFTKEIDRELIEGRIDAAVHSLKDVPSKLPEEIGIAAVLEREDARDVLVATHGSSLAGLRSGARLGTGSVRRKAQILALRSDLQALPIRGNVDTRLRRWQAGEYDALLLAAAGLRRLSLDGYIAEYLDASVLCPCAGQGALALTCRAEDAAMASTLLRLNHEASAVAVHAERALIEALDCDCDSPVGAWASLAGGRLHLMAICAAADGSAMIRAEHGIEWHETAAGDTTPDRTALSRSLGKHVAQALLRQGAAALLHAIPPANAERKAQEPVNSD